MAVVRRLQAIVEADGVSDFESSFDGARKSLSSFKKAVGVTGGALAVLGGTAIAGAINEARKFESAMVELEKVTNPDTARQMSDAIMEMAETIPLAQKELADIAADAGRFGVRGPKNIRSFTESVAKMASATDLSASRAGESLAKLATLTETPIPKVENLGSAINELSNNFATSAGEVVDSMLRASGAMSQFGMSQTDIAGFSAALNAVSESSERAGTRLRRLVQEISNPKKTQDLATSLGYSVEAFKKIRKNDPTDLLMQMASAMKGGGRSAKLLNKNLSTTSRQALAGLGQNLDGLKRALDMSARAFKENTSLQKEFEVASKTLNSRLKILANRARNSAISLGMDLMPAVKGLVEAMIDASNFIAKANKNLDGMLVPATLASSVIVGLGAAFYFLAGGITAAQVVAWASGIGIVLGAVALLTAAIIGVAKAWKTNWMGIRTHTKNAIAVLQKHFNNAVKLFNKLKTDATLIFNRIKRVIVQTAVNIRKFWNREIVPLINQTKKTFNQIKNAIRSTTNFIQNRVIAPFLGWLTEQWNKHGTVILEELRKTIDAWSFQFNRIAKEIRKTVRPFLNWLSREWNKTVGKITKDLSYHWNRAQKDFNRFVKWFNGATRSTLDFIFGLWNKHGDQVIDTVSFFLDTIKGIVEFQINAIRTVIVTVLRLLRGDTKGAWKEIKRFTESTLNGLRGFLDHWGGKLIQWGRGTFNAAKRRATDAIDGMKRQVSSTVSSLLSGIKREAQSWITNFVSPFQKAKERVIGKFNDLKRTLVGNSVVPDMLGMIMDETGDWKGSFQGEFQAAAFGAEDAMKNMPSEVALPTPGGVGASRNGKTINNNNTIHLDVTVPQGVDVDTASRTIADEVKSIGGNNW